MPNIRRISPNHYLVIANNCQLSHCINWFDPEYLKSNKYLTGNSTGRKQTQFFQVDNQDYVLRHYYRGGLVAHIVADKFLYTGIKRTRAFKEIALLEQLIIAKLPVPIPSIASITINGARYSADLIMQRIKNANTVGELLAIDYIDNSTWADIGSTIAEFHNQRVYHADLNLNNILIDRHKKVWLIDFDKCKITTVKKHRNNLKRLKRSLLKNATQNSVSTWGASNWLSLISSYNNKLCNPMRA